MPELVTRLFADEAEAEQALSQIAARHPLLDSAVLSNSVAGSFALDSLALSPEERAACERQLNGGGFLLVAQVATAGEAATIRTALGDGGIRTERPIADPSPPPARAEPASEERIPIVEEELRIGKREVLRGGARVHAYTSETPVREQVELTEERTLVERRPVGRRLTEEEVAQGGLLQNRVIEVTRMREEAVVTKEPFVREEVVIMKKVEHRIEQINETVRRTEVEVERLEAEGRSVFGGFRGGGSAASDGSGEAR